MSRVDFYYDFSCPYAYLGHTQIERVAARAGAELVWKPMLLGGVFKHVGMPSAPMEGQAAPKVRLNALDMHRWADHFAVPLVMPPTHPNRTVLALRATLAANALDGGRDPSVIARVSKAMFKAYWVDGADVSSPDVVKRALDGAGFDGTALVAKAEEPALKDELRVRTDEAIAAGVFGAPAFVVNGELYWGQDRLDFVERALGGAPAVPRFESAPGQRLDFFFDISSPFAYLASTQVAALAARHHAKLVYKPFLLGALFKEIGTSNVPMMTWSEQKRTHTLADMNRHAALYGAPFRFPSRFPMNTVKPLRMILATDEARRGPLVDALFKAYWGDDRDVSDDATLEAIATSAGFDGASLLASTKSDAIKEALRAATDEARDAGLCGAPTFRVGDRIFWGQDRMLFVEKALAGWVPRNEAPSA